MLTAAIGPLSVEFWLIYLATVLVALRLHRAFELNHRLIAAVARRRRSAR
jgi:hypothetical protein